VRDGWWWVGKRFVDRAGASVITDAHRWIYSADDPLRFDDQYGATPAYYGVLDAFWRR
jgi:hypothetical protein